MSDRPNHRRSHLTVSEVDQMQGHIWELQTNALPTNCTVCHGKGSEPPHGPEDGPCPRCGGWTAHKRLVAAEPAALRAELTALRRVAEAEAKGAADAYDRAAWGLEVSAESKERHADECARDPDEPLTVRRSEAFRSRAEALSTEAAILRQMATQKRQGGG